MKVAVFSTEPYDRQSFDSANTEHEFVYFDTRLEPKPQHLPRDLPQFVFLLMMILAARR